MTYCEIVKALNCVSDEPQSEAKLIINELFSAKYSDILLNPDTDFSSDALNDTLARRKNGEPLQYIIGKVCFYNAEIKVSPDCLIPRSDTELLCETVINLLPERAHFLELCTGSGCIPVAILKNRDDVTCESIELFEKTAALALENREHNNISSDRLNIRCADALTLCINDNIAVYDAIVSNPPYIPTSEIENLSKDVLCEPKAALDGGHNGMLFYNTFLKRYSTMLKKGGFFAFEIGFDQAKEITELSQSLGFDCEIIKDYSKNDRVAIIRIHDSTNTDCI